MFEVASTALELVTSTTSKNPYMNRKFLADYFDDRSNKSAYLCRSSLFQHCRLPEDEPASSEQERQLSAKLHVYYGLEVEPSADEIETHLAKDVHPYARSRVYDLRRYNPHNMWGPFMNDGSGRVDWEKVQAILVDLGYNLRIFSERTQGQIVPFWDRAFFGLAPDSFVSHSLLDNPTPHTPLELQDPYGVTGTWMRIVCFLDYNDLFSFNFEAERIPADQERGPIATREAFRLIFLKLRVTKIDPPEEHENVHPSMPVVHFAGTSRSMHMSWDPNANSKIRGTSPLLAAYQTATPAYHVAGSVHTTPHGDIRWTTFSIFHGQERWRSEGVQIGGINSARGILGNWFDKDFDPHGPAGPTAFWKISNDVIEEKRRDGINGTMGQGGFGYIFQS